MIIENSKLRDPDRRRGRRRHQAQAKTDDEPLQRWARSFQLRLLSPAFLPRKIGGTDMIDGGSAGLLTRDSHAKQMRCVGAGSWESDLRLRNRHMNLSVCHGFEPYLSWKLMSGDPVAPRSRTSIRLTRGEEGIDVADSKILEIDLFSCHDRRAMLHSGPEVISKKLPSLALPTTPKNLKPVALTCRSRSDCSLRRKLHTVCLAPSKGRVATA